MFETHFSSELNLCTLVDDPLQILAMAEADFCLVRRQIMKSMIIW